MSGTLVPRTRLTRRSQRGCRNLSARVADREARTRGFRGPPERGNSRRRRHSGSAELAVEQGNRTPRQRLSAPSTGFEDQARHQPRTLYRARVYVALEGRSRTLASETALSPQARVEGAS